MERNPLQFVMPKDVRNVQREEIRLIYDYIAQKFGVELMTISTEVVKHPDGTQTWKNNEGHSQVDLNYSTQAHHGAAHHFENTGIRVEVCENYRAIRWKVIHFRTMTQAKVINAMDAMIKEYREAVELQREAKRLDESKISNMTEFAKTLGVEFRHVDRNSFYVKYGKAKSGQVKKRDDGSFWVILHSLSEEELRNVIAALPK